ncbi:MAG: hypothetical protein R3B06_14505 [Kofleriaceae bacterium]
MRSFAWVVVVAVVTPTSARAHTRCASDGISAAVSDIAFPAPTVPAACPVEFYVGQLVPRPLAVFHNGVEAAAVAVTTTAGGEVARDHDVCSSVDPSCRMWIRDSGRIDLVTVAASAAFVVGDTVGLGRPGDVPWATVVIGDAGACPPPRPFTYEMCSDVEVCTGGAFTCAGDGGVDHDGGLCDGGLGDFLDAPAAGGRDEGGGCAAGGGAAGPGLLAAMAALVGRRRRRGSRGG